MLALQTVGFGSILMIILSYILYSRGYKKEGINLCRGTIGAFLCWGCLVLVIGFAPDWMG